MTNSSAVQLRSIFESIGKWCRTWSGNRQAVAELDRFPPEELSHIASDTRTSPAELRALAAKWPDSASQLPRRMTALGLNPEEVSRKYPAVANDLRRLCSMCADKGHCEHDLDNNPGDPVWERYCPNKATLNALRDETSAQSNVRKTR